MSQLLEGRTAVITGATSGIGRAIALGFADHGADIVVADIQASPREGGEPTHERIAEETASDATFVECDVTDVGDLEAAVEAADAYGGIDVMINNAGIFQTEDFTTVSEDDYQRLMDVNVKGVFFGSQAAAKRMAAGNGGSIINMSSIAGIEGGAGYVAYSTSKGAVRLMTYSIAATMGPEGIRANTIHPGPTQTEMTKSDMDFLGTGADEEYLKTVPSRRLADPIDIANVAVFLASDLAEYVNGESIIVDGGNANTRGIVD